MAESPPKAAAGCETCEPADAASTNVDRPVSLIRAGRSAWRRTEAAQSRSGLPVHLLGRYNSADLRDQIFAATTHRHRGLKGSTTTHVDLPPTHRSSPRPCHVGTSARDNPDNSAYRLPQPKLLLLRRKVITLDLFIEHANIEGMAGLQPGTMQTTIAPSLAVPLG